MEMLGIRLVGVNAETGQKLLLTMAFIVGILLLRALMVGSGACPTGRHRNERVIVLDAAGCQCVRETSSR
jgi:hypothetical protein